MKVIGNSKRNFLLVVSIVFAVVAASGLGSYFYTSRQNNYPLPAQFNGNYHPLFPDKKYDVKGISTAEKDDVLLYEVTVSSKRAVVTQQPIPDGLDFKKLMSSSKYLTKYGEAEVVNGDDYTTVSLLTGSHWFLVHSQGGHLQADDIRALLDSLSQVK